jgi:hypothetical protein
MPSSLHITTTSQQQSRAQSFSPASPIVASPFKLATAAKKMSVTQAYFLAHKARAKLSHEAARPDHNLRLLVGHANLLDSLMLDLAEAEREQESWFNQSVRGASSKSEDKDRHIQWADSVVEEPENDWHAEDADSDSESDFSDDDDVEMADIVSLRRIPSYSTAHHFGYDETMDEDDADYEDDEEDFAQLALQRSPSHSQSPPELDHDSDTSEDESMPPSPPTVVLPSFSSDKQQQQHYSETSSQDKDAFYDEGYYLPPRNPARLVSAISVY